MIRRVVVIIASLFFLLGCTSSNDKELSKSKIIFATLKGPSSMGMIKLIDSLESAQDSNIEIKILNEPIQVRKMIIDGTADFAVLPTTMAALVYNKGLNYKLIAVPVWGTLYLFGNDTTISQWNDLKGKRIHVMAKGMTPDVLFKYLLKANGIDPEKDVILDYSFPTHIDLANAISGEQAQLGVISEPMVSLAIQKNSRIKPIFDLNHEWQKALDMPIAQTALLVSKNTIDKNPELIEQILEQYKKSSSWVNSNPEEAANLIAKYNILPNSEVALKSIPRSNLDFVRANEIKVQIENYLKVFFEMDPNTIGGKMPDEEFIY